MREFLRTRFGVVALSLLFVQSLLLTRLPLLNTLGLEFAVASAPLLALLVGLAALRVRDAGPAVDGPWFSLLRDATLLTPLPSIPLIVAAANALFVRNCALAEGLLAALLVLLPAHLFAVGLAHAARGLAGSSPRTVFISGWAAVLSHVVIVTFAGPQIFAYNPIVGYFPGFSYDDALSVLPMLALYRVSTLLGAAALAGMGSVLLAARTHSWRLALRSTTARVVVVLCGLLALWWSASDRLGFGSSVARLERELGGVRVTEHFVILYPAATVSEERAEFIAARHEFLYDRLRKTLRVAPVGKITSVLYASPNQKARLVGAGRTDFSKPWLRQMHVGLGSMNATLQHEMTHVLAAEFGFPLLRVGLGPGVVEGLAVALERESNDEPIHRAAAQVFAAGYRLPMSDVFGLAGFFRTNSSVSYTLAGSFCRYLIEQFGMRRFKVLYRTGSFPQAFTHRLEDLEQGWLRRIGEIPLGRTDTVKALYYYRRPATFTRECVRVIGNLNAEARTAMALRDDARAMELARESWTRSRSPEAATMLVQSLVRLGRYDDALAAADSALRDPALASSLVPLGLWQGDALWGKGAAASALAAYRRLLDADLSAGWNEVAAVRLEALSSFPRDTTLRAVFIRSMSDSTRAGLALSLANGSDSPFLGYVASRFIDVETHPDDVIRLLDPEVRLGRPELNYALRRRRAAAELQTGSYERAKADLWEALNDASGDVEVWRVEEGIAWADWLKMTDEREEE